MTDNTDGVLAVLVAEIIGTENDGYSAAHLVYVRDRVAELLSADEDLDDARIAACQTSILTPLDQFAAVMDRFYAAQVRRAAAIRACGGGK